MPFFYPSFQVNLLYIHVKVRVLRNNLRINYFKNGKPEVVSCLASCNYRRKKSAATPLNVGVWDM